MTPADGTKPNPDPTIATNEAVERAMKSERDYVDGEIKVLMERLRGIDTATKLLQEIADRMLADIATVVNHLRDLMDERFGGVQTQFKERDIRAEREARDNKVAVDAAFAAQKEAAAKQDEANAKAIDKSEKATAETIKTNQELSKSTTDALTKSLDEVKLQVSRIESVKQGGREERTETRAGIGSTTQLVGAIIAAILLALGVYAATQANDTATPQIITVEVPTSTTP